MTRDETINAMASGERLHLCFYEEGKKAFWLEPSLKPVRVDVGERVISDPLILPQSDTLFPTTLPQTFKHRNVA